MSSEERAQTIRERMTTDMTRVLFPSPLTPESEVVEEVVDDAMFHVEHLLTEIEGNQELITGLTTTLSILGKVLDDIATEVYGSPAARNGVTWLTLPSIVRRIRGKGYDA